MYLTKEEFLIARELSNGTHGFTALNQKIGHLLSRKVCTNDPRIDSLYQKYNAEHRGEFLEAFDINKVEVRDISDIPYFEYDENMQLVKKIPIRKKDINKLVKFFEGTEDDNKEFKITYAENGGSLYRYMKIDEVKVYTEFDGVEI